MIHGKETLPHEAKDTPPKGQAHPCGAALSSTASSRWASSAGGAYSDSLPVSGAGEVGVGGVPA